MGLREVVRLAEGAYGANAVVFRMCENRAAGGRLMRRVVVLLDNDAEASSGIAGPRLSGAALCVAACLLYACASWNTWLLNHTMYPAFTTFFPLARDIATAFSPVVNLALIGVALRMPRLLLSRRAVCVSALLGIAGGALAVVGVILRSPALSTAGACLLSVARAYASVLTAAVLVRLESRACVMALAASYVLKYLLIAVSSGMPVPVLWGLRLVMPLVILLASAWLAADTLARMARAGTPADLSVTNPLSFVPFTSLLFVTSLMFNAAFGCVLTFGAQDGYPQSLLQSVVIVGSVAMFLLLRRTTSADTLYCLAFGLVLAGILFVPVDMTNEVRGLLSVTLLQAGSDVFALAMAYFISRIGARSIAALAPIVLTNGAFGGVGTELGATLGNLANMFGASDPNVMEMTILVAALVFAVYNFVLRGRFSFNEMLRGVEPLVAVQVSEATAVAPGIDEVCERLAAEHRLTARESQTLRLLARGRNVAFIQQELGLSRNTVKTYVAGVYAKLGVHSHQDLIDLIEVK